MSARPAVERLLNALERQLHLQLDNMASEVKTDGMVKELELVEDASLNKANVDSFTPSEEKALVRKLDLWYEKVKFKTFMKKPTNCY